jgi:hypothetical protein
METSGAGKRRFWGGVGAVFLLAGLVVLAGAAGYWWNGVSSSQGTVTSEAGGRPIVYRFESELPGVAVAPSDQATPLMEKYLKAYGYSQPPRFGVWQNEEWLTADPTEVVFVFKPIESISQEEAGRLLFKAKRGEEIVGGSAQKLRGSRVEYTVYLELPEDRSEWERELTYHTIRALFAAYPGKTDALVTDRLYQELFTGQETLVRVGKKAGWLGWAQTIGHTGFDLVPQVWAQICYGNAECGEYITAQRCANGATCTDTCTDGSSCIMRTGCYQTGTAPSGTDPATICGNYSSQGACLGAGCNYPTACLFDGCNWGDGSGSGGGSGCDTYGEQVGACQGGGCPEYWMREHSQYNTCTGWTYWCENAYQDPNHTKTCMCVQRMGLREENFNAATPASNPNLFNFDDARRLQSIQYVPNINFSGGSYDSGNDKLFRWGWNLGDITAPNLSYGRIYFPYAGNYDFSFTYTDGLRVKILGGFQYNDWTFSDVQQTAAFTYNMPSPGWRTFSVETMKKDGPVFTLQARYRLPGVFGWTVIPTTVLRSCSPGGYSRTCSVSITAESDGTADGVIQQGGTITLRNQGNANEDLGSATRTVRFWIARPDRTQIPGGIPGCSDLPPSGGQYNYLCPAGCNSLNANCSQEFVLNTASLPTGYYQFFCDIQADVYTGQCSGNTLCNTFNSEQSTWPVGARTSLTNACTGWKSCSNADAGYFQVTAAVTPTPTSTPTPSRTPTPTAMPTVTPAA